jgi:Binding-protein-dependent transport system inner membrane component
MLANLIAVLGQSLPQFWVGIVLIQVFAVHLRWLPVAGNSSLWHYILPGFTLGWFLVAGIMRLLRSSMLDVLDSEFVKLARIKGVSGWSVIWKHALKNAVMPVLTFAAIYRGPALAASWLGDHRRGLAKLPGSGHSTADPDLGFDDRRGPGLHCHGLVDVVFPGSGYPGDGPLLQSVWRLATGCVRP